MKTIVKGIAVLGLLVTSSLLSGCSDPQIYGSIGVSSSFGSYYGSGSRMHTSISVGGRIR